MLDRYDSEKIAAIEAAEDRLRTETDGEAQALFVRAVFSRAPEEDLAPYAAADLATLAAEAYAALAQRAAGEHRIRFADHQLSGPSGRRFTVVEILNDDMPFLLDSIMGELMDLGIEPLLVSHPILAVARDGAGKLVRFAGVAEPGSAAPGLQRESLITLHVPRLDEAARNRLAAGLDLTLTDVRHAVNDEKAMRARLREVVAGWKAAPPAGIEPSVLEEACAFASWLDDENFVLLGIREYAFVGETGEERMERRDATSLGILRDLARVVLSRGTSLLAATPQIRAFLLRHDPLIVTKTDLRSRVHRRAEMDYVGLKLFDGAGRLSGEVRLVGLFTRPAYVRPIRQIPLLRRKAEQVLDRSGLDLRTYSGKSLLAALEGYPRDELFQIDVETLQDFATKIMELSERPRIRVLARHDEFSRFVSLLVYLPRERYDSDVVARLGRALAQAYAGSVRHVALEFPEGPLARLYFVISRTEAEVIEPTAAALETAVAGLVRTWEDDLREAAEVAGVPGSASALVGRWAPAFDDSYRAVFPAVTALGDIAALETLRADRPTAIDFLHRAGDPQTQATLRLFQLDRPIPLSRRVPVLEDMGFRVIDERTFRLSLPETGSAVFLHDMTLERASGAAIDLTAFSGAAEALFMAVWQGRTETDGYNALLLDAGLAWRDIAVLRAVSRYLRQIRIPYSQDYMWGAFNRWPELARLVVALFHARFDPDADEAGREARVAALIADIEAGLEAVTSLDDDRIVRRFTNVVKAIVRTNFFMAGPDGQPPETLAFKLDSHAVEKLPAPRPFREIWVYSPRVEGIHLRFGKVARGGLRWSDRPQDFRTEVLGLVKAQQVKNAVIVPVGAKGGFVPKQLPPASAGRDAVFQEGTEAYKIFVSSLIQITDNLVGDRVQPPARVVRYDGDDPYLVVAADKGTATFSDTANAIAEGRGFWLGDAFASGGSAGYDHKKMGITARGAWEAVKRHFREVNVDIQTAPFTVAGVGDMSGDVFGNGMLLSRQIRLVAAFDHRDIFLDPDPDTAVSFAERERLFTLPRSSWADYNGALISAGGGVFSRQLKSIPLSPQVQAVLGLQQDHATPQEVMSAILSAQVDLLWFGGIGTYIRAASETDADAGDRANDAIRIDATRVRAKVVGEGANLGVTQRGRIEASRRGVRINSDAIDNSAGVNTSDVEVNLKIALATPVHDGRLDRRGRDALLAAMTDDVAHLVLSNNYRQTLALSLAGRRGLSDIGFQQRLMQSLEKRGLLDRSVEFLPDDATIAERVRGGEALARPELAVLLAYGKLTLYDDLLASSMPDDPYLARDLAGYFPKPLREAYPDAIESHRLRREIIATIMANDMINRGGPAFAVRLADETGADPATVAAGFAAAFDSYRLGELYAEIDALDNRIDGQVQLGLYEAVGDIVRSRTVWFVRNVDFREGLDAIVTRFRTGIDALAANLGSALPAAFVEMRAGAAADLAEKGVPEALALRIAALKALMLAPDAVIVADRLNRPVVDVGSALFAVALRLRIENLASRAAAIPVADYYDRLALDRALESIASAVRAITAEVLATGTGEMAVDAWLGVNPAAERIRRAVEDIAASDMTVARLTVAAGLIGDLAQS